jgi:hypothetical protein
MLEQVSLSIIRNSGNDTVGLSIELWKFEKYKETCVEDRRKWTLDRGLGNDPEGAERW